MATREAYFCRHGYSQHVPGERVVAQPDPQTAFRFQVPSTCEGLAAAGLTLNSQGQVEGTVAAASAQVECPVTAEQDPQRGLSFEALLALEKERGPVI